MGRSRRKPNLTIDTYPTGASYCHSYRGAWPRLLESIYAAVEPHHGQGGWLATCQCSLPNERREQWNTTRRFVSRDEAAAYAGAFVIEAERIVEAIQAGGGPYMPHRAMADDCRAAIAADSTLRAMRDRGERMEADRRRLDLEIAWYRAHDFRDYVLTFDFSKEAA